MVGERNHSVLICIKLAMNLFFYMALAPCDFDAGQRHYLGHWKGWAMKVSTFLGPTNRPRNIVAPHQNHNGLRHTINRFINSYIQYKFVKNCVILYLKRLSHEI